MHHNWEPAHYHKTPEDAAVYHSNNGSMGSDWIDVLYINPVRPC